MAYLLQYYKFVTESCDSKDYALDLAHDINLYGEANVFKLTNTDTGKEEIIEL